MEGITGQPTPHKTRSTIIDTSAATEAAETDTAAAVHTGRCTDCLMHKAVGIKAFEQLIKCCNTEELRSKRLLSAKHTHIMLDHRM